MDSAYAGAAAVLPELRHHFAGLQLADSFNMNAHKWLLTNFDCSPLWVRRSEPLKQALSLTPAYLRAKGNTLDFKVCSYVSHALHSSIGSNACKLAHGRRNHLCI